MNVKLSLFMFLPVLVYSGGDIVPISALGSVETIENIEVVDIQEEVFLPKEEKKLKKISNNIKKEKISSKTPSNPKYYVGMGLSRASFDGEVNTGVLKNGHPLGLNAKVGYAIHDNLALESRIARGIQKDEVANIDNEWKLFLGAYVKPKIELLDKFELFSLIGYGAIQQKINNSDVESDGLSYGAGLSYFWDKNWALTMDAIRTETNNVSNNDVYSTNFEYKF